LAPPPGSKVPIPRRSSDSIWTAFPLAAHRNKAAATEQSEALWQTKQSSDESREH
jgi:hypothetical protein